jgi:streptomycin 6-kinase
MTLTVPGVLTRNCRESAESSVWLERLPATIQQLQTRWSITAGQPFDTENVSCAWVAPALQASGKTVILKLGMPHMEGKHEIAGLHFWDGDPTVRLIEADEDLGAMLLERCEPGTVLRELPEPEQDVVIAALMRRLWRTPARPHPFRHLSELMAYWRNATQAKAEHWPDPGIVRAGLDLLEALPQSGSPETLLATDLHAGNVLRATRKPWLVIDPKPFVGDTAYDATQHLFNCMGRLSAEPEVTIERFADLLDVDRDRVRLWTFARAAAESRDDWTNGDRFALARRIAP